MTCNCDWLTCFCIPKTALKGSIFNVYDSRRYVGIVNETGSGDARTAALREWPDLPFINVTLATADPSRRRDLIRREFLLPHITTGVQ